MPTVLPRPCKLAAVQKKPVRLRCLLLMLHVAAAAAAIMACPAELESLCCRWNPCGWPGRAPADWGAAASNVHRPESNCTLPRTKSAGQLQS